MLVPLRGFEVTIDYRIDLYILRIINEKFRHELISTSYPYKESIGMKIVFNSS